MSQPEPELDQPGSESDQPAPDQPGSESDQPAPDQPEVPAEGRVVLLLLSPRLAPGLLTWPAWQVLASADVVLAADPDPDWHGALAEAGVSVRDVAELPVRERSAALVEAAAGAHVVVWLGSPDADPGLTDALAEQLARRAATGPPPEIEVLIGSHDVQGARLLDLVAVMDRLRSPGGCPWDAEQSHASLLPYLLEEAHEVIEAVENGDREHFREELGDLLLQVVFHARVAEEDAEQPFDIDAVAAGIVAKLVRRHPHVFAGGAADTPDEVARSWEQLKAEEKGREGPFEGIPASLPALARAQKMLGRLAHRGLDPVTVAVAAALPTAEPEPGEAAEPGTIEAAEPGPSEPGTTEAQQRIGAELLALVARAEAEGVDAESALRRALAGLDERHAGLDERHAGLDERHAGLDERHSAP